MRLYDSVECEYFISGEFLLNISNSNKSSRGLTLNGNISALSAIFKLQKFPVIVAVSYF